MRIPGVRTASVWSRRAAQWITQRPLIFLYHRVATVDDDPWSTCVSSSHFEEQIDTLRRYARPLGLAELLRCVEAGRVPRSAVTVTFDDGYSDFLHHAKPVLERYEFPATLFVTTGAVDSDEAFWWDELQTLLSLAVHSTLRLDVSGQAHSWRELSEPDSRRRALQSIYALLRPLAAVEQRRLLGELRDQIDLEPPHATPRALTLDELRQVAENGLVEIGAHTVTHPVLATLPEQSQQREVQQSRAFLEECLGRRITSFAYPHGGRRDFTQTTAALVRRAGFRSACAAFPGSIRANTDPFCLPRIGVGDYDGDSFRRRLRLALDL